MQQLTFLLLGAVLLTAACGSSTGSRAVTGGAIGAGTGAAIGAVTGMDMSTGALIGGGLGAVTGAATDRDTIDLGYAPWD